MSVAMPARQVGREMSRTLLRLDSAAVAVSASVSLAFARPIDRVLGLNAPGVLIGLGAIFLPYAALLLWLANRPMLTRDAVLKPVILNAAWVVASAAMLITGRPALSTAGAWTVALVAAFVGLLAIAQGLALRRMA